MSKVLFLSDYFADNGILGGAERSDRTLTTYLRASSLDVIRMRCNVDPSELELALKSDVSCILLSNRVFLGLKSMELIQDSGIPYYILERDCQFVKSRDISVYRNFVAPPSQLKNPRFYAGADAVFALCHSHYWKISTNIKANVINLGCTHLDPNMEEVITRLRGIPTEKRKHIQRIGVPKVKKFSSAARYAKLLNPDAIVEYIDQEPDNETFLTNLASYRRIAFIPDVYESFSRLYLECQLIGCDVITENKRNIGIADSEFWQTWASGERDIRIAFSKSETSMQTILQELQKHL